MADPKKLFELFYDNGVQYVVIDLVAAALHGFPVIAESIAVCPLDNPENNGKIAQALKQINARLRLEGGSTVAVEINEDFLARERRDLGIGMGSSFATDFGIVDLVYVPVTLEKVPSPYKYLKEGADTGHLKRTNR